MPKKKGIVKVGAIQQRIFLIRGVKVIIDADLAEFYGVPTKRLNEQVKRNADRFPGDFMFQLDKGEKDELVAKCDHLSKLKYSAALPHAFTEHGALMAATVLSTHRAVEMSVFVVRAFVQMREVLSEHKELARRVNALEAHLAHHDDSIKAIVAAIRKLMDPEEPPKIRRIGFIRTDEASLAYAADAPRRRTASVGRLAPSPGAGRRSGSMSLALHPASPAALAPFARRG